MGSIAKPKDFQSICSRIHGLSPDSKAQWGIMNVHQMLAHCADPIRCARGDFQAKDVSTRAGRSILKWLVLLGMPAPKGKVRTVKDFDPHFKGTKPTTFEADRKTLIGLVEWMHYASPQTPFKPHPYFGPMTKSEWSILSYTHLDHHLKQFGV